MTNIKNKALSLKTGNKPDFKKKHFITADAIENSLLNGFSKATFPVIPIPIIDSGRSKNRLQANSNSDEKLKLVMNAALDAIICIDTKGDITFWNSQSEVIFGWSESEALGQSIANLIIPERYRSRHINGMALYLKTGKGPALNKLMELSAIRKGGEEFPIELTIMPIKQEGEEFFCAFIRDITERKKAEKELQEAYHEKNTILESIDDGFFAIDTNSLVTYWNRKAEELLGEKREAVIGRNLHEMFSRPDSKIFYDNYQKAIRENSTVHFEGFSVRSNKWFAVSAFASDNGLSVHFKDVTQRKAFEEKVKESELRYRSLVEQATDTICIFDSSFKFTEINPSGCKMFGYTKEEILNLSMSDVLFEEDLKSNPIQMEHLRAGKTTSNERRVKRKDGSSVDVEINGKMLEGGKVMIFGRDISERKEAEDKLKKSENKYRTLFEKNMAGVYQTTEKGVILNCNKAFAKMLKYDSPDDLLKINASELYFSAADRNNFCINALTQKNLNNYESVLKCKDGSPLYFIENVSLRKDDVTGETLFDGIMIDITEKKQAELQLKESELRYRSIIEQATDAICIADASMKIMDVNPHCCEMLGYTKEEFLLLSVTDIFLREDMKENPFKIAELKTGKVIRNERRLKRKDGTLIEVEINGRILEDGRFIVFAHDITERKKAENNLKESNERYNLISKATNDMVWDWDLITNKVYRNKEGWKKIFRTPENKIEKAIKKLWGSRIHPEDRDRVKVIQEQILTSEKDFFEVECRVLRDDGTYAYIHDKGHIIRNEHGKAVRLIGATQDITLRKEAELQVTKSEVRFRSLVQNSSDLIGVLDKKGYYLYTSPAVTRILGYDPEFIIGKNSFAFIHPDDTITIKEYLSKVKTERNSEMPAFRFKNSKGEWRWLESKVTDMTENPDVQGYIFNTRDITERKIAEENLIKTSVELQHALTEQVSLRKKTEESETKLKDAQTIAHLGHWNFNFATQSVLWSDEACRIFGLSTGENKQPYATWVSFIHPDDLEYAMKTIAESEKTLSDTILNHRIVLKDGSVKYIASKSKFEFDENGKAVGLYGISHDITESKIAEAEIKKLSIIARETSNAVIITNPEGEIVWVNEGFTQITEFELEEVMGKKPGDFLQGDETNLAVVRYMRMKLKKTEPFECDILNYSKSGRKYWLRIQAQPQFDETGKLKYFFAIETDITKEKEAEEILKASEERYRYLFNNNPASIFIWDLDSLHILEINDAAVDLYGYAREEFLTKSVLELNFAEDYDKIKRFASIARKKDHLNSEVNCKHISKSGEEMYMHIGSHLIQFKGKSAILAIASNITDKVLLENELEKERMVKQQEITQAVISAQEQERQELGGELHDNVNQILAGSLLYLGLAKKELKTDHPYLKETDTLINTAITEIRNLSHSLIPPSLHESEFLDTLKNLTVVTQKTSGIMISLQACGFDESNIPDKLKLTIYRIVQEQINNILKHADAHHVIIQLLRDNEKTLLSIKDDGMGFDTSKKAKGVGLLNIKTRASLFNGDVSIISCPGKGCEIRVLFN